MKHTFTLISLLPLLTLAWVHPGILETSNDLARLRMLATSTQEPWKTAYAQFSADFRSSSSYAMQGPFTFVTRDKDTTIIRGMAEFAFDSVAALQTALMWTITGDASYAIKSVEILNGWGKTLQVVNGTDGQLAAALSGSNLVNAAEIIRSTYNSTAVASGWSSADIATFSNMITNVLLPPASQTNSSATVSDPFEANWGTAGEKFMLAVAVFTENATLYDYTKELIIYSSCSNLTGSISPTGQSSETGRDQIHTQFGLGNYVEMFYTLMNQEEPRSWFLYQNNRLAKGLDYTAAVLLNQTVSYDPSFCRCNADLLGGPWLQPSPEGKWPIRPVFELGYAIYHDLGVELPNVKTLIALNTPDGQNPDYSIADGSAFQTLRYRRLNSGLSSTITRA